jgi:ubiquinone/menaquinone biosynthesis C-methylase UbiE
MWNLKRLEKSNSWQHETEIMEQHIRKKAVAGEVLHILEAGCGRNWPLNLNGVQYILTGVDLDPAALEIRKNKLNDMHETIEGDLRFLKLPENSYDVIYSSYVLEHVEGAEQVLKNFLVWLKPMGLIIIRIPDASSVQGFITRITPHWFHVLYYRYILGRPNAGKPGYEPYPVHYGPVVSRRGIHQFSKKNNLTIMAEYGDGFVRPGRGIVKLLIHTFKQIICVLSLGLLSSQHTNLLYILQKKPASSS